MRLPLDWLIPALALGVALGATAACGSDDDGGSSSSGGTSATGGSGNAGGSGGSGNSSGSGGTSAGGSAGSAAGGNAGSSAGGSAGSAAGGSGGTAGAPAGGGGTGNTGGSAGIPPEKQNLRVAFIGDTHSTTNFKNVLGVIKAEKADFVIGLGDYDYNASPSTWITAMTGVVGASYPMFGAAGNHDASTWSSYADEYKKRLSANGVTPDDPNFADEKYSFVYKGLKVVFAGQNGKNTEFASYIDSQLANDDHIWKICGWHKNQSAMQVGGKGNEMGWDVYENCRKAGAIIATAHEHSYERTKTLTDITNQLVDSTCSDGKNLCVGPGRTFVYVSGLGGQSIRDQQRCLPVTPPYGCKGEWAFIYTSDQNASYGALFIDFYVGGNPKKAHGYFKNVANQVVEEFDITKD